MKKNNKVYILHEIINCRDCYASDKILGVFDSSIVNRRKALKNVSTDMLRNLKETYPNAELDIQDNISTRSPEWRVQVMGYGVDVRLVFDDYFLNSYEIY